MPEIPEARSSDQDRILGELVGYLVKETPSLGALGQDELIAISKAAVFDSLKADLISRVELKGTDYACKRKSFLGRCAKKSKKTERIYSAALDLLDDWTYKAGIGAMDMKASHADAFIASLEGSPATVGIRIAGVSSFFSFLERETNGRVRNPFRGTKARPKRKPKIPKIPTEAELAIIMEELSPPIRAAVVAMTEQGFRVGAIRSLVIRDGRYAGTSKGKPIAGAIAPKTIDAIRTAGLDSSKPWGKLAEDAVRNAFKYATGKLFEAGNIGARYSVHDIRHYFAIREYRKDKDIYRLKTLLGHASIQVTENYLRGPL